MAVCELGRSLGKNTRTLDWLQRGRDGVKENEISQWLGCDELSTCSAEIPSEDVATHTPCRVEFIKQVLPWFMSPGGRLASFSASSRFFLSM